MSTTIIGVDPHKRTHTAVVLDEREDITAELRVTADRRQVDRLLAWANDWPQRVWAIENANGLGRLLSQQLVRRGETVLDVPATLSARARKLSGMSARKTDPHDARSVVIAAEHHRGLRRVTLENDTAMLGLLVDRRWHLVSQRQKTKVRLHALLLELVPGGLGSAISLTKAAKVLRSVRATDAVAAERKQIARELMDDWRWLNRRVNRVKARLRQAVVLSDTTLTEIFGIGDVGAASILSIVGDVARFPSAGHFAAFNGTAPIEASSGDVKRHRLSRRGNRKLNKVLHTAAATQIRHDTAGRALFLRKLEEGKTEGEAVRALKRQLSDVIYRRLLADERRRATAREGQVGTRLASA